MPRRMTGGQSGNMTPASMMATISDTTKVRCPLGALVEPGVVVGWDEGLHLGDLERLGRVGGCAGGRATLDADKEGVGNDGEQKLLRIFLVCDRGDVLELRVCGRREGFDRAFACGGREAG